MKNNEAGKWLLDLPGPGVGGDIVLLNPSQVKERKSYHWKTQKG
jgi:hypothetical protein